MLLDSFRTDPVGLIRFGLVNERSELKKYVTAQYIGYTKRAFDLTCRDIQELEYTKGDLVPQGQQAILAVSL